MAIKFLNTVQVDTDVLYVDASSDKVGIGTTNPSTNLEVSPSSNLNGIDISQSTNASQSGALFFTTSDTTEGFMFRNSNGTLGINYEAIPNSASGDNKISIIGSSGNVGIGTTNPDSKLNVEGPKNTAILTLGNTTVGSSWVVGDRVGGIDFYSGDGSGGGIGVKASISYENAAGVTGSAQAMVFRTGGTTPGTNNVERMRLQYDGNVGIGTTSPDYTLEVNGGNGLFVGDGGVPVLEANPQNGNFKIGDVDELGDGVYATNTGTSNFDIYSTGTVKFRMDVNGNVGIGTTIPNAKLEVAGSTRITGSALDVGYNNNGTNFIQIGNGRSTDGYAYIDLVGDSTHTDYGFRIIRNNSGANTDTDLLHRGTGDLDLKTLEAGDIGFHTTSVQRMIVKSGGDVGIGTTIPQEKMHVSGSSNVRLEVEATDSTVAALKLTNTAGSYASFVNASGVLNTYDYIAASVRTTLLTNGNFGIGATSPGEKLEVNGNVKANNYINQRVAWNSGFNHGGNNGASYYFIPVGYIAESTADTYYNNWIAPYAGRVRKIVLRNTGQSTVPTATTVNFRVSVNGSVVYEGSTINVTGSGLNIYALETLSDTDAVFSATDRVQVAFRTNGLWRNAAAGISLEYTE